MSAYFLKAAAVGIGLLYATGMPVAALAQEPIAFTLPVDDGYGIGECLSSGSACGEGLATAFCQAHGHLKALAFGAADTTGTTPGAASIAVDTAAVSIRCGD